MAAISVQKTKVSPLVAQIVEGAVESAKFEIEAAVDRTARSLLIKEQHDYRAAVFTAEGTSVSSASFCAWPSPIFTKWPVTEVHEGDVFLWNDVYLSEGGIGHLPDLCVTRPVFYEGRLMGWTQVFGHTDDVGGMLPGGMPPSAQEVYQEGIMIPPLKLYDTGVRNDGVYDMVLRNSRFADKLQGDLDAEVAATAVGVQRLQDLCRRLGPDTVEAAFEEIIGRCARSLQEDAFPLFRNGEYYFEDFVEWDWITPQETRRFIRIALKMTKTDEAVLWDFSGTDSQVSGSINWPIPGHFIEKLAGSHFRTLHPELIVNDGVSRVTDCYIPPECFLQPKFPASTSNRMWPMLRIYSMALALFNMATDGCACDSDTNTLYGIYGYDGTGDYYFYHELPGAGQGGRPFADGIEVANLAPEARNTSAEVAESAYPIVEEACDIRMDSGGAGKFRGGNGHRKEIRLVGDSNLTVITDRYVLPTWGAHGGQPGATHRYTVNPGTPEERVLPKGKFDKEPLAAGDLLRVETSGGGGWGDPLEREVERVRMDVVRRLVSPEKALTDYGVVLEDQSGGNWRVDPKETDRLRREMAGRREPSNLIERGPEFARLEAAGAIRTTVPNGFWADPE